MSYDLRCHGGNILSEGPIITTHDLNLWYHETHALESISMSVARNQVTALIGPSGCGKSTLLRCFNRLNDLIDIVKITGKIMFSGRNIHEQGTDVVQLRKRVGMVFQKPNPFPKSVYENVAYGPRVHGTRQNLTGLLRKVFATPRSGTRSGTGCTTQRSVSPEASSSGSVLHARLRLSLRSS